ncbi:MAG: capsule biosynthesis protein [Pseudomonadota bacterium]
MNAPARIQQPHVPDIFRELPAPVPKAPRRRGPFLSFVILVVLPLLAAGFYLVTRAAPQFESSVGFSVRREEAPGPIDLFGGFSGLSASGSSDADILYEFLTSQELVAAIDTSLDLRALWSRPVVDDPVFAFHPSGTVEDLLRYWQRMVRVSYDSGTGILTLRARAFSADEAQAIAAAAFDASSALINTLSAIARDDMLVEAHTVLGEAEARVRTARSALTDYRARTQIVDPGADVSGQMGLLTRLQEELANELIRIDLLRTQTRETDPRIAQAEQRISVIESRIAEERGKLGAGSARAVGADYATVVAEYERLQIDVEFAEQSFLAARTAYDQALAEARRQTRYLAAHIRPTRAERATAPDPLEILGIGALFLTLVWAILALTLASLRERS